MLLGRRFDGGTLHLPLKVSQRCFLSCLQYSGRVDENVHDVVVMRIKAVDKDLEHSDNWLTVFKIINGNADNLFSIETDPETNEGVLKLIKVFQLAACGFFSIWRELCSLMTMFYLHPNSPWISRKSRT